MSYALKQSLEGKSLLKVTSILWNQDDIRSLMKEFNFLLNGQIVYKNWQIIEDKVKEKVPHLFLPEPLNDEILLFIKVIGVQILRWFQHHFAKNFFRKILPSEFCFTLKGPVDRKKTAEVLIKDESVDIITRFTLACIYCSEDNVHKLWNEMPENGKESFSNNELQLPFMEEDIVNFWVHEVKGEMSKFEETLRRNYRMKCSPYRYSFECAAHAGNKVAVEYFFQKLTSKDKRLSMINLTKLVADKQLGATSLPIPKDDFFDVLCFLLVHMTKNQKEKLFSYCSFEVVECFLEWPWQNIFMQLASEVLNFLSEQEFFFLLLKLSFKAIHGDNDYNYQKFFTELWQQSDDAYKRFIIDDISKYCEILLNLFMAKDEGNLKMFLEAATPQEKVGFIMSFYGPHICQELVKMDEYDLLKFFFLECLSTDLEVANFKTSYKDYLLTIYKKAELLKEKWRKSFRILNELASDYYKGKSTEEKDCKPAKRFKQAKKKT